MHHWTLRDRYSILLAISKSWIGIYDLGSWKNCHPLKRKKNYSSCALEQGNMSLVHQRQKLHCTFPRWNCETMWSDHFTFVRTWNPPRTHPCVSYHGQQLYLWCLQGKFQKSFDWTKSNYNFPSFHFELWWGNFKLCRWNISLFQNRIFRWRIGWWN